jgi:dGTPase
MLPRQTITALIDILVGDAIDSTAQRLGNANLANADEVRRSEELLVGYSDRIHEGKRELKEFLREHFYYHPRIQRMTARAEKVLTDLFEVHRSDLSLLPEKALEGAGDDARRVADYLAGMTDRFALATHAKLVDTHDRA